MQAQEDISAVDPVLLSVNIGGPIPFTLHRDLPPAEHDSDATERTDNTLLASHAKFDTASVASGQSLADDIHIDLMETSNGFTQLSPEPWTEHNIPHARVTPLSVWSDPITQCHLGDIYGGSGLQDSNVACTTEQATAATGSGDDFQAMNQITYHYNSLMTIPQPVTNTSYATELEATDSSFRPSIERPEPAIPVRLQSQLMIPGSTALPNPFGLQDQPFTGSFRSSNLPGPGFADPLVAGSPVASSVAADMLVPEILYESGRSDPIPDYTCESIMDQASFTQGLNGKYLHHDDHR